MDFFKPVFKSIFNRRDVKIFLAFIFLPILVPIMAEFMDGLNPKLTSNFLAFLDSAVSTQFRFVLPVLLFSLVISSVFRDEIDSGIMFLYKDINRTKIFNAKFISLIAIYGLFFIGTVLTSLVAYYGLMAPKGMVATHLISENSSEVVSTLFSLLTTLGLNVITIALVVMVSISSKTVQSVLTGVFFSLASSVAPMLIGIRYLFPNGYVKLLATHFSLAVILSVIISVSYFIFFYIKGKNKFKKIEF
ncbi:amino acid transporter [Streptococcus pacificus]|uniref:Amino acid transporter n=1 Tax=Streptococcus pacificus TaxID=2740577 RepID=A0ABS0ZKI1_9STRE|nr:amino acid transporter [Streptococcus pacificus]MBJ8326462.1 amino acid transporter [Streptococcus pacificus]